MQSVSILIPALMGYDADRMGAQSSTGRYRALCWTDGAAYVGRHEWTDDPAIFTDPQPPSGGWTDGLTQGRVDEIKVAMIVSASATLTDTSQRFGALAAANGATWGAALPTLPAAGIGETVTAGELYQTDDRRYPVVRVVQTHARTDPSHDDLSALFALFEPIRNPWHPAPWVQPQGTVGVYRRQNIVGGPDTALWNGQVYASAIDNNVWSPSDYPAGWAAA